MFEYLREITHLSKPVYHADKNKRRRLILVKDTLYVFVAYCITLAASFAARSIGLMQMPYSVLLCLLLWACLVTVIFMSIILSIGEISSRFADSIYTVQFVIWLATYSTWVYYLEGMRSTGLLFALMAVVFLFSKASLIQSYLLAGAIAGVQAGVSFYGITFAGQPGSVAREAYFAICFFPVALFITYLSGHYTRQNDRSKQARHMVMSREALWRGMHKTIDNIESTRFGSSYLYDMIFEFCGAAEGCVFSGESGGRDLRAVFSKMDQGGGMIEPVRAAAETIIGSGRSGIIRGEEVMRAGGVPAAPDDALFISFKSADGTPGVCCLVRPRLMDAVAQDEIDAIQGILSRSLAIQAQPPAPADSAAPDEENNPPLTLAAQDKISKAISFIRDNFNSEISRDGLASHLDLSPNYFGKLFTEYTGMKMNDFITDLRISEATRLLRDTGEQIIDIAFAVGFNNLRTFNRAFFKCVGMTPREYRSGGAQQGPEAVTSP